MLKKIMVAYDEGKVAAKALDKAIELAQATSGEIYIACAYMTVDNPIRRELLEKLQAQAAAKVVDAGIVAHTKIASGDKELGKTLARMAEDLQVDLVVTGTNNRGAVGQFMFGSVSKFILRNVTCPVLVVK